MILILCKQVEDQVTEAEQEENEAEEEQGEEDWSQLFLLWLLHHNHLL